MIWKEIQFENILLKILENFSASCLETKMINDHRLFSTAPVADILSQFLLNTIIAHFEKMTLRLHGVNLIYYMPSHCTDILTWKQRASVWYLEQESQRLILGTSSLLKIIKSLVFLTVKCLISLNLLKFTNVPTFCHLRQGNAVQLMDWHEFLLHTLVWHSWGPAPPLPPSQSPPQDAKGFASTGSINLCKFWERLMETMAKKQKRNCKPVINLSD